MAVRWGFAELVLILVLCVADGVRIPVAARPAVELAVLVLMITAAVLFALDHHRHCRDGLDHRSAFPPRTPTPSRRPYAS